jgi:hypothetical protein
MGAIVLSQEKKNFGEGFEYCINGMMTFDDSGEYPKRFMGLCNQSHYATSPNVACSQSFELRVTTFGK